ncbi:unnamed protein product [Clavelina lepadiformis]|uniref:Uncharacterized protein n=1 Tax=Clavelina lepadiformis TaxID=159417 RepID=A0ABP0FCH8_CLALP
MEVNLISLFLLVLSWNIHFCNAQTFSSLAPSSEMQAIGSDVEISTTVNTSPPFTATWRIDDVVVGSTIVNSGGTLTSASVESGTIYESRIEIDPGFYTANEFTTVLTIQALLASEDGITVDVGTSDGADNSLNLNVQECSLNTTAYPSLTFTCDDSSCEFNSAGTLSCADGYTTSGVSTTSTTCQANATVSNLDVLSCAAITTTTVATTTVTTTAATTLQVTTTAATTSTVGTTTALTTTYNSTTTTSPTSPVTTTPATTSTDSGSTADGTNAVTTTPATTSTADGTNAAVSTTFGATGISNTALSTTDSDFQADNSLNDSVIYSGNNTTDSNAGEAHILFLPWSLLCCFHILYFLLL